MKSAAAVMSCFGNKKEGGKQHDNKHYQRDDARSDPYSLSFSEAAHRCLPLPLNFFIYHSLFDIL